MENKKVSIVIPAYNEIGYIGNTIEKMKSQDYDNFEIIVVDNSEDGGKTYKAAKSLTKTVLRLQPGLSNARNQGAKTSSGQILLFCDADSWLDPLGIRILAEEFKKQDIVGSFLGKDQKKSVKSSLFFFFKNWAHRLNLYHGVSAGTIFCSKETFLKTGGFNTEKEPAELRDFIKKAKAVGAKYKIITNCHAYTSMRRYEKKGYVRTIGFWVMWKILNIFKKEKKFKKNYYKEIK